MTVEELKEASDALLLATPARQLADQVCLLSTLLEMATQALEKYPFNNGMVGTIKTQHRKILMGYMDKEGK